LTVRRGEVIVEDGKIVADRPCGRFLRRAQKN
jgi:hypothetical protein